MKKNIDSIAISEPNNLRRNIAKELGADHIINPSEKNYEEKELFELYELAFEEKNQAIIKETFKKIEELKHNDINFNEDIELLKRLIDS